jgi:hypothetical protein
MLGGPGQVLDRIRRGYGRPDFPVEQLVRRGRRTPYAGCRIRTWYLDAFAVEGITRRSRSRQLTDRAEAVLLLIAPFKCGPATRAETDRLRRAEPVRVGFGGGGAQVVGGSRAERDAGPEKRWKRRSRAAPIRCPPGIDAVNPGGRYSRSPACCRCRGAAVSAPCSRRDLREARPDFIANRCARRSRRVKAGETTGETVTVVRDRIASFKTSVWAKLTALSKK